MEKSGTRLRRLALRSAIVAGAALTVVAPTAAFALDDAYQDPYPTVPTTPTTVECTPGDKSVVCGTSVTVPGSSSSLAFTGGDSAVLAALGVGAIGSGGLILLLNRRRSTSPAA